MKLLPDNKLWIIPILIIAAINPLQYIILETYPPEGYVFSGMGGDDSVFFTTMESVKWGLTSPWSADKENIFMNPAFGPVYILVPIGLLSIVSGISTFALFMGFKFFAASFFMLVAYQFIKRFSKNHNKAYFLFLFTAGFGGIFVLLLKIFTLTGVFEPTPLYAFGISMLRIVDSYKILAFATALLAILLTYDNKYIKSGIVLGLTVLFYPFFGVAAALLLLLLAISDRQMLSFRNLIRTILISVPFAVLWLIPYLLRPSNFASYAGVGQDISGIFLPTLVLGWGPAFVLACFWMYKTSPKLRRSTKIRAALWIAVWVISLGLFSFANLAGSFWATFDDFARNVLISTGLLQISQSLGALALVLEIPLFLLVITSGISVYRDARDSEEKFMILWMFILTLIIIAPPLVTYSFGAKIQALIWIPIVILGAEGISIIAKNRQTARKILLIALLLSLPTLILLAGYTQTGPRENAEFTNIESCCYFYTESERAAMDFLSTQPRGLVLASKEIGTWTPAHSGQITLLHLYERNFVRKYEEKNEDVDSFFALDENVRKQIIDKYGIEYVFDDSGVLAENEFMEKIFEQGNTRIFRVVS